MDAMRISSPVFFGALLVASLVSDSASAPATQEPFRYAVVRTACTPSSGPVFSIVLTTVDTKCGKDVRPSLSLTFDGDLPEGARSYEFEAKTGAVRATLCPAKGECSHPALGSLKIVDLRKEKFASGSYDLRFPGRSRERGLFNAQWCPAKCPPATSTQPSASKRQKK